MAVYLKEFDTQAAYEAAQSGLILPNVSLITDNNTVHYTPSSPVPPTPTHDFVEIGGIKWATMNVGANSVTDTGLYFQWGDISGYTASQVGSGEGQKYFGWADYKYCSDAGTSSSAITKYNDTDGKTVLEASDDAVTAAWGGNWRMPTVEEFEALVNATTSAWTSSYEESGFKGIVLTSNADSSKKLFFPACGNTSEGRIYDVDFCCNYWLNSLYSYGGTMSYYFYTCKFGGGGWQGVNRYNGYPVRGVLDE